MHHRQSRRGAVLRWTALLLVATVFTGGTVHATQPVAWPANPSTLCDAVDDLVFNGTRANESVQWQVSLGPRLPGSDASEAFRAHLTSVLEPMGYEVTETVHHRHGMNLTNFEARWPSTTVNASQLVLSAHYDSRNIADHDTNASNRTLPVPGANDGASGAAVLFELAHVIPQMTFEHDIVLFWNDGEDQNDNFTVGAEAWAENLTDKDIERTEAFILLDMVGDADLQLRNINPGNDTLKSRVVELGGALGLVADRQACDGELGDDIVQYEVEVGVLDDHYHAHVRNIPSLDIMDPQYGEAKAMTFGSYWHTMEDTPEKVSATSLEHVGRLVELGLRTDAFVSVAENPSPTDERATAPEHDGKVDGDRSAEEDDDTSGIALLAGVALGAVCALLAVVEWKGKP
ncbi:MAG: M28 family peptidase [Poseidonia sp.]